MSPRRHREAPAAPAPSGPAESAGAGPAGTQPAQAVAEVAVTLPVRGTFHYAVPAALGDVVVPGVRVLVPFGRRHVTGYVLACGAAIERPADAPATLKPIADALDATPLFGAELLAFFRWLAAYYETPLGLVIRSALPAGLNVATARRVALSEAGRAALDAPDAPPVLAALHALGGEAALATLLERSRTKAGTVAAAERRGLVVTWHALGGGRTREHREAVAIFRMQVPLPRSASKAARVLATLATHGVVPLTTLRAAHGDVRSALATLERHGAIERSERRAFRVPSWQQLDAGESPPRQALIPTPEQRAALEALTAALDRGYQGFLVHGVTGSGKTEVYLQLIAEVRRRGAGAIVLVPEIALTPQLVARFRARFGDTVAVLHSGLSDGQRLDQWEQTRRGELPIVVGARSAIFAPVVRLGLVIVDEEHEASFKQEEHLRYHARDLALVRGQLGRCPVVLGSATPALESFHNAERGKLRLVRLKARATPRPLPEVTLVDLRTTPLVDPDGILSAPLFAALEETMAAGDQALVLVNRRGYSPFVLCRRCGHIVGCPRCSISLTLHRRPRALLCHYCDHRAPVPERCPKCEATALEPMGVGTEKAAETLATLLPGVAVQRMDRDTTRGAALGAILRRFRAGETQVLVGTQMLAKGHDFPGVTLVGVLLADQGLKFPDFRAAERTFQLLTQAAGRAGRGSRPGRVLIQTYDPGHPALVHATSHGYDAFAAAELPLRAERGYPPFVRLALVRLSGPGERDVRTVAERVAAWLRDDAQRIGGLAVLGPSPAPLERIQGRYRYQVLVKATSVQVRHELVAALHARLEAAAALPALVQVDLDPQNLL